MIRVLQMIGTLDVGGSQTMLLNLYRNIDRETIQFDFVLDHPDGRYFVPEIEALGGRIYTLAPFRGTNAGEVRRDWNNFFYTHPEYTVLHSHVRSARTQDHHPQPQYRQRQRRERLRQGSAAAAPAPSGGRADGLLQ